MSFRLLWGYASGLHYAHPIKTTYLLQSPAGSVDEEVVGFLSRIKEFKQLKKMEMTFCANLSPSLIAAICGGLCSCNSMEELVVTLGVSVCFPYTTIQTFFLL